MNKNKQTLNSPTIEEDAGSWLAALDKDNLINLEDLDIDFIMKKNKDFATWISQSDAHRVGFLQLIYIWKHEAIENTFETKVVKVKSKRSIFWAIAASILFITLPAINFIQSNSNNNIYQTATGARETIALSDGSKVELNSGSKISATISKDERIVTLSKGEAFFDIAHQDGQPFRVIAGKQLITVLGTKFSVHKSSDGIKVVVSEGKVQIDHFNETDGSNVSILTKGAVAVTKNDKIIVTHNEIETIEKELSWRKGLIIFDGTTLKEAAEEFNRYNKLKIKFSDDISKLRVSGQFESQNYDAFLRLIAEGYGLKISYANDENIIKISS